MFLSNMSIKRPVTATMMSLALIVFGSIAYFQLPVRELPDVDPEQEALIRAEVEEELQLSVEELQKDMEE